jgi:23S rRNA-/tRNA-specific pseudouridylate synthase
MLADRILFIDAEAMVIDKPAGLPVDTPRRGGDSVVGRLGELKQGFQRPPTPMHRLDQDTSGCLLLARSPKARSILQKAFETRQVGKYYLAIVDGVVEEDEGTTTSVEGRVIHHRQAVDPPHAAKQDWTIICELAARLGTKDKFSYASPREIFEELRGVGPVEQRSVSAAERRGFGARCDSLGGHVQ